MTHHPTLLANSGMGADRSVPATAGFPEGVGWMVYIWYTWYQVYTLDGSARTPAGMADILHLFP